MKVILSKEDIENLVKEYFDMESVAFQKDGTIVIDTTLEKITNEKNDMKILNEKLKKKKQYQNIIGSPHYIPSPYTTSGPLYKSTSTGSGIIKK